MLNFKVNVEEFDKKINNCREQIKEINQRELEPLYNEVKNLVKQKNKYIVETKKYKTFPLDKEFFGKRISNITFINQKCETEGFYDDDVFYVDGNGYPYYSSYENGILSYSKEDGKFIFMRYGLKYEKDFIGYIEINIDEEDELCEF